MFSFIAPLLVVLSLIGIVVILLRKTPEVKKLQKKILPEKIRENPGELVAGVASVGRAGGRKIWEKTKWLSAKLWEFVLGAKELSKKTNFSRLQQKMPSFKIKKPKISLFDSSDSAEFFIHKAEESVDDNEPLLAERQYIKAIKRDPRSEEAYSGLGQLYLSQKKFTDARETYEYLVKQHLENDSYYSNLAQALHGLRKFRQALTAYKKAIRLNPEDAKRLLNMGITLEALDKLDEAVERYKEAVGLEPDNVQFLAVLAEGYVKQEEREAAEEVLEQILKLEPTNHSAREKLMKLKF